MLLREAVVLRRAASTWTTLARWAQVSFFAEELHEREGGGSCGDSTDRVRSQRHIRQHIALLGIIMPAVPVAEKAVRGREMFVMPPVCFLVTAHVNR
ncbi:hypothetical protein C5B85_14845 [Pseudoclavibacter sp. AY1F1]|nr:hypothetical protein C5B85_14845 [Pseudoclavibacter sp. AY1F1]